MIPTQHFGEPAWDILLDLFIRTMRGQSTRSTSACIASCSPPTTALRYLDQFVKDGMVIREENSDDKRVVHVRLSDVAIESIGSLMMIIAGIEA